MSEPIYEGGIVVGNTYDKYGTRNPLARALVSGFLSSFDAAVDRAGASSILEVGCGPGDLSLRMAQAGHRVVGTDVSRRMIAVARSRARAQVAKVTFYESDLFDLDPKTHGTYGLVVCCEVLEHLEKPELAIQHLKELSDSWFLFSVPREPIWRILNLARGRYWRELGNTPGHLQHWSRRSFLTLLGGHFQVVVEDSPFPWTMALCRLPR